MLDEFQICAVRNINGMLKHIFGPNYLKKQSLRMNTTALSVKITEFVGSLQGPEAFCLSLGLGEGYMADARSPDPQRSIGAFIRILDGLEIDCMTKGDDLEMDISPYVREFLHEVATGPKNGIYEF